MCSAVWKFREGGYELGFNRDEKWARPASLDPEWEGGHPVPGACARDGAAGGTWLFTNVRGITLAVMNAYPGGLIPAPGRISRGEIPFLAAAGETPDAIQSALTGMAWENFAPCDVLLVSAAGTRHFAWDGNVFSTRPPPAGDFLTTSSVRCAEVCTVRTARFGQIARQPVAAILDDEVADDPAEAIHVTRADGGTVSRTSVIVDGREIRFTVTRRGGESKEIIFPQLP